MHRTALVRMDCAGADLCAAICVCADCTETLREFVCAEFSEAFRNIVLRLKEAGYNYVRFDNAQENIPAFPTFDW